MVLHGYTTNIVATVLILGYINSEENSLYRLTAFKTEFLLDLFQTA
jgi:hypothetical protein